MTLIVVRNNRLFVISEVHCITLWTLVYRQQLRENSHELRDLERKLKMAYTNKELAAQIAQKEADKVNEMASNYNINLDRYKN